MSSKDIWYGVLEAGEKSSPVVLDSSIDASDNKIYLYNYVRDQFVEYAKAIVEPKLRELAAGDISIDELDTAFKAASLVSSTARKTRSWSDKQTTEAASAIKKDDDSAEFDIADDVDIEDFIDDD